MRCKNCKDKFKPKYFLQKFCMDKNECIRAYLDKINEDSWKKKKKELKENLKTVGQYEQEARIEFQKWIRHRDDKLPCISCGKLADRYDAGHYFKAELYSGLIFHVDNVNKQCVYCNKHLHGNESNYRIGLVKKIGEERVKWLEENKDRLRVYKFTKIELIEIKEHYKNLNKICS